MQLQHQKRMEIEYIVTHIILFKFRLEYESHD